MKTPQQLPDLYTVVARDVTGWLTEAGFDRAGPVPPEEDPLARQVLGHALAALIHSAAGVLALMADRKARDASVEACGERLREATMACVNGRLERSADYRAAAAEGERAGAGS